MKRRTSILATVAAVLIATFSFAPSANAAAPDITGISASPKTIYPLVNSSKYPGSSTITVAGDPSTVYAVEIWSAANVKVRDLGGEQTSYLWDGRNGSNTVVPGGVYTVKAVSSDATYSSFTATITVSGKKMIRKTYTKTVTAAGSLFGKQVGKCSTLRKPAKRGWKGSLGYYANTKCKTKTFDASAVLTVHRTLLPVAEKYVDFRVNLYGGAAKARKTSRGLLLYANSSATLVDTPTRVTAKLGNHPGKLRSAAGMISSNRLVTWSFSTPAPKTQYEIKNFTVVVHYDVLG